MPQSLARIPVHVVFTTKDRVPMIPGDRCEELHAYCGGVIKSLACTPIAVGGTSDHLHALFDLGRQANVADVIGKVKANSSRWIKQMPGVRPDFSWQSGYGAFAVSHSNVEGVRQYIQTQAEHHRVRSVQDEIRDLLLENGVEFDDRFVWD